MRWIAVVALTGFISAGAAAATSEPAPAKPDPAAGLTAAQIVEKNVVARGGLEAWRAIQTMVWAGHVQSPAAPIPSVPFVLEEKRPNKSRFEIVMEGQKSLRVFDGTSGWKARAASNGKPDVQPYNEQEIQFARDAGIIDGPLIDYEAKGVSIALGSVGEVDGRKAYRINAVLPSGMRQVVWIDAETFLDLRLDRETRNIRGQQS